MRLRRVLFGLSPVTLTYGDSHLTKALRMSTAILLSPLGFGVRGAGGFFVDDGVAGGIGGG